MRGEANQSPRADIFEARRVHDGAVSMFLHRIPHPAVRGSPASIVRDVASLHHDVAVRLRLDLAAALNRYVLALDDDRAVLLHRDAGISGLQDDRVTRIDAEIVGRLCQVVLPDITVARAADLDRLIRAHLQARRGGHVDALRGANLHRLGPSYRDGPRAGNLGRLAAADVRGLNSADVHHLGCANSYGLCPSNRNGLRGTHRMGTRASNGVCFRETNRRRLRTADRVGPRPGDRAIFPTADLLRPMART